MTFTEKSRASFQDKLTKQNEINRQLLVRELSKIDETAKQDTRILDIARQRFRSRYKKFGVGAIASSGSKAIDVQMYETHNPGFCYHCTGAIKESGPVSLSPAMIDPDDSYEFVKSMLFTNGEVDIEKLLCLHLLAAHTAKKVDDRVPILKKNSSSHSDRAPVQSKPPSGAWNNFLPCYVVEIQRDLDGSSLRQCLNHEIPQTTIENEALRDFQLSYETYARDNDEVVRALTAHDRMAKMAPRTLGKMPIISPHVYAILGASHEFRVKRSIAEGQNANVTNAHHRSSIESIILDPNVRSKNDFPSFHDYATRDIITDSAIYHAACVATNLTKAGGTWLKTPRISSNCGKIDRSITMLKGKSLRDFDDITKIWRINEAIVNETKNELVTIKPSYRFIDDSGSKIDCEKNNFHGIHKDRVSLSSTNSSDFTIESPRCRTIMYQKSLYLNSPIEGFSLKNHEYHDVDIFVNIQIQALVHSVLEVLERVSPDKVKRIHDIASDIEKIRGIFERADMQNFMETLLGQPIVTSPKSFVVSRAIAIDEIDTRLENLIGDQLIAVTLELPAFRCLGLLVEEIRDNIFGSLENSDFTKINICNDEPTADEKEMPPGKEDKMHDDESPMKCKTKEIIDPYDLNEENYRKEIRALHEFDKLEEKAIGGIAKNNHYRVMNKSTIERTSANEINDKSKTLRSFLRDEKCLFKPQKVALDIGYMDPDRVILRRMTNSQRIMVGRMCAALKNRRINNEGLIREKTPLAALITPVLSRESIKILTRGTIYSKYAGTMKHAEKKEEQTSARSERLTGPVLAKVRRDIAEHETNRRLDSFFAN